METNFLKSFSKAIKVYMKYEGDFGYMGIIQKINDVDNRFLSRREITCNFTGLSGKLKRTEATKMISQEFQLTGKVVIPVKLKNQVGRQNTTGIFYVYDDENLAKKHVNPTIFTRLEKTKAKEAEAQSKSEGSETEEKKE